MSSVKNSYVYPLKKKATKLAIVTLYIRLQSIQIATFHSLYPFLLTNCLMFYRIVAENRKESEVTGLGIVIVQRLEKLI